MTILGRWVLHAAIIAMAGIRCAAAADAPSSFTSVTCTNTVSHAAMQIRIDFGKRMVNADPAQIGDTEISWHDDKEQANYTLNRKTGMLDAVIPSSTGGYFLHYQCDLRR
jgi:hypothetical protein